MLNAADEFTRHIESARDLFFHQGQVPSGVSTPVVRSWQRSRQSGLLTSDCALFSAISAHDRREVEMRSRRLIDYAAPEMERLYTALSGTSADWVICCVDDRGAVVKSLGDERLQQRALRAPFRVGVTMCEQSAGTTAPGCALLEKAPVVVNANEHFLEEAQAFSCMAAPLFGPDGGVVGALDVSCPYDGQPLGMVESLVIATRAIENRMLHDLPGSLRIGLHYRADLLGTPMEAIIACSEDGRVIGANPAARQLLRLTARHSRCDDLFALPFPRLVDQLARASGDSTIEGRGGLRLHARLDAPRRSRSLPFTPPASATDPGLYQATDRARRAYARDIPVLINGETGTGKEVLARELHTAGPRRNGPFVAINCSAIPASLIESELFGYEDGAFTNARKGGASGRFEQAHGGTLFLDEIGDMPLELQSRLLRVLQERCVSRIGSAHTLPIDVAVVCATHQDLETRVADGLFREDLYYRINGMRVTLPPLRERNDLPELVARLLAEETGAGLPPRCSDAALALLARYRWPGNIRQLRNVLRIAVLMAEDTTEIGPEHLPDDVRLASSPGPGLPALARMERDTIHAVLQQCNGNVSRAARQLGIARATLYRKLKDLPPLH